ncbi:DUF456 domain-containing protein [Lysobacter pythonis]|uniref:DUF456 domain-containing protein n=1 Tax=Solilutibacter pythonis TaxID=2483112 RepID=A0A3M2HMC8_9GAMM|nr:DUF456 domain-containing protein [Lysobacter pythonis]RMH90871.1 DUF456 domain-containing protein [Lysobacter pythonis]
MDHSSIFYVLAAILVAIGMLGILLPALPGLPLVFAGLLLAAWADGFQHVHWGWMIPLGLLTALSLAVDFWATAMGAKRVGASRLALVGAMLGTLAGLFFGPFGLLAGPFVGALAGELLHRRRLSGNDLGDAAKIGLGTWLGIVFGVVLKLTLAFAMIGLFALVWLIP